MDNCTPGALMTTRLFFYEWSVREAGRRAGRAGGSGDSSSLQRRCHSLPSSHPPRPQETRHTAPSDRAAPRLAPLTISPPHHYSTTSNTHLPPTTAHIHKCFNPNSIK
ncbi:hypothetical protein E2C01_050503 [Portunus trituberculatus]|uniref:Uncharacterized protein n=1 Tax=Portunus trituberculatus TaxID=210409 RepID=A0A5B7G962_PORTR|nr:hypothetical protein [Portunus trituberculatus]